jgi:anti-sigma factor RsiW
MTPLDHYVLQAYLDGELDAAAAEAFEFLLLERPDLAEWVDADTALRMGLAQDMDKAVPQNAVAASAPSDTASLVESNSEKIIQFPKKPRSIVLSLAVAASLLIGVGLGNRLATRSPLAGGATLVSVDMQRSSAAALAPEFHLPPQGNVVLMVPVATLKPCAALIEIRQQGREVLAVQAQSDDSGSAYVVLANAALSAGQAKVVVRCADKYVGEYPVTFTR